MTTETNGLKMWTKRIALATAVLALLGLVGNYWTDLGLPVPASAADLEQTNIRQAEVAIQLFRDQENDLETRKREYRWRMMEVQKKAPSDTVQQHNLAKWIAELDNQIQEARSKRMEYFNRKLELERSRK